MSNETFLISIKQNNDLSTPAVWELRESIEKHPLSQRKYIELAALPGNSRKYSVNNVKAIKGPLFDKQVLFLGSSVTLGYGALGESFVDYLWKRDGIQAVKDAENGTTLCGNTDPNSSDYDPDSYINRFYANFLVADRPDAFVLQLSTNDATKDKPLGQIVENENFDTKTITGALEFIIANAQKKWHCPVLLYTNPPFDNPLYQKMVDRALTLQKKYHFELLDLYHDPAFQKQDVLYKADPIHPTRAGYQLKWLPKFEEKLTKMLA
ncbi:MULTISPECIES: SGNH/GDSL hydrolase family protein [Lactobacillus]|uniref:SGNH/GDSL hydrolase family protein n=1 Tax=Lactobacillus TaxID=1578 RepID=UPI0024909328|nr:MULTISPECIES: SGNH/GDSL hydrolase family protein [Lactobacillus]